MGQNFSFRVVFAGMVLLNATVSAFSAAQPSETRPIVNVLVMNYSIAPATVLVNAAAEASRIFAQSGIDLTWTYCPLRPSPETPAVCESEPAAGQIRVRVLGSHLNNHFQDSIFGFAIAPTFATVYYDSAQLLLKATGNSESNLPAVLGSLIAHEIGHLLLGENQHAASGIMRARWDIQQVQLLMKGALEFNPPQAVRMRMHARSSTRRPIRTNHDSVEMAAINRIPDHR